VLAVAPALVARRRDPVDEVRVLALAPINTTTARSPSYASIELDAQTFSSRMSRFRSRA